MKGSQHLRLLFDVFGEKLASILMILCLACLSRPDLCYSLAKVTSRNANIWGLSATNCCSGLLAICRRCSNLGSRVGKELLAWLSRVFTPVYRRRFGAHCVSKRTTERVNRSFKRAGVVTLFLSRTWSLAPLSLLLYMKTISPAST